MALWTAEEAVDATGGDAEHGFAATGVSIDTRTLQQGDLFVALTAERDGHDFVGKAFEAGAAAAMVTHRPEGVSGDAPLLIVPDVQAGLEALGRAARARSSARVLAITGSVGKTSAKEMARTVLSAQGRTHAAEASYNNHWGVPLTLARMPQDTEFAVIEIGMNHPGEIAPLAELARPHVALITTIAAAHLEAFDSLEGIAREKAAIFEGLEMGGTAIVNMEIDQTPILLAAARSARAEIVGFGQGGDWQASSIRLTEGTTIVQATTPEAPLLFKLQTAGRHFATNGLGVLAAAQAMGADPVQAAMDIGQWLPPAGRGTLEEVVFDPANEGEKLRLLDDAFNANPTSLTAALEVLASYTPVDGVGRIVKGRRVAVLGDMLELGPEEIALHAAIADSPFIADLQLIHCAGPRMKALFEALPDERRGRWAETAEELASEASHLVDAGDVVLVKGSKGSKVSRVVDAIRKLGHPDTR